MNVGSIDFDSEPAYWHEKTMRDSERAGLPTRHRPPISRDEALIAREVRRHLDRVVMAPAAQKMEMAPSHGAQLRSCAACGQRFSRRDWNARRLWRVIYPRGGGSLQLFRHLICPAARGQ